jgi:hypothetical protein
VIGQKQLEQFRDEMSSKINDAYTVLLREKKLPLQLLEDPERKVGAASAVCCAVLCGVTLEHHIAGGERWDTLLPRPLQPVHTSAPDPQSTLSLVCRLLPSSPASSVCSPFTLTGWLKAGACGPAEHAALCVNLWPQPQPQATQAGS